MPHPVGPGQAGTRFSEMVAEGAPSVRHLREFKVTAHLLPIANLFGRPEPPAEQLRQVVGVPAAGDLRDQLIETQIYQPLAIQGPGLLGDRPREKQACAGAAPG
jgi:hypothetical protein